VKALLSGAAIAAVAGMLMGAAAKPDLGWDDRPAGPQILAGWPGERAQGPFDDGMTFAAYKGQIPDYVLGADWKRSLEPPAYAPDPEPRPMKVARTEEPPDLPLTRAAYQDEPAPEPVYPSLQGGGEVRSQAPGDGAGDGGG
jgi:hypothetical protein